MSEYIDRDAFVIAKRKQYCEDCERRKGMKNGKLRFCYEIGDAPCRACSVDDMFGDIEDFPAADVRPVPPGGIGEMSDGYHTFNGLYYQRKVLFASLVNAYKENAWKSYRHEDGELCYGGGWFIVGVETPKGNYTYHYENKDFDLFDCKELPVAPHWDGHTEGDVTRLLSLPDVRPVVRGKWVYDDEDIYPHCSECQTQANGHRNFCSYCGADMRKENGNEDSKRQDR